MSIMILNYKSMRGNGGDMKYTYDAFISYRHGELDSFVAENLHKLLETYKVPKNINHKTGNNKRQMKRIFRDRKSVV